VTTAQTFGWVNVESTIIQLVMAMIKIMFDISNL